MVIFEKKDTKIEIKDCTFFHCFLIKSGEANFEINIKIEKIYASEDDSGNRIIRISGKDVVFQIYFSCDSVIFSNGFFSSYFLEIELSEENKKQIQENLEKFCRDFWRENDYF